MSMLSTDATSSDCHVVLSIDVGGSHVKILTNAPDAQELKVDSGPSFAAVQMIAAVKGLSAEA